MHSSDCCGGVMTGMLRKERSCMYPTLCLEVARSRVAAALEWAVGSTAVLHMQLCLRPSQPNPPQPRQPRLPPQTRSCGVVRLHLQWETSCCHQCDYRCPLSGRDSGSSSGSGSGSGSDSDLDLDLVAVALLWQSRSQFWHFLSYLPPAGMERGETR